jgi:hypothetical protein
MSYQTQIIEAKRVASEQNTCQICRLSFIDGISKGRHMIETHNMKATYKYHRGLGFYETIWQARP